MLKLSLKISYKFIRVDANDYERIYLKFPHQRDVVSSFARDEIHRRVTAWVCIGFRSAKNADTVPLWVCRVKIVSFSRKLKVVVKLRLTQGSFFNKIGIFRVWLSWKWCLSQCKQGSHSDETVVDDVTIDLRLVVSRWLRSVAPTKEALHLSRRQN